MSILSILFPLKCVACGEIVDGSIPLCRKCRAIYEDEKRGYCNICKRIHRDCRCKLSLEKTPERVRVLHLAEYNKSNPESVVSKIVFQAKRKRLSALDNFMSGELEELIKYAGADCDGAIVTNVPRSRGAVLEFGTDQAENLARKTAKRLKMKYVSALCHIGSVSQKELSKVERKANAENSLRLKSSAKDKINGKIVILVDDVITTGATMLACVKLLFSVGATAVICVSIGRTKSKN